MNLAVCLPQATVEYVQGSLEGLRETAFKVVGDPAGIGIRPLPNKTLPLGTICSA